MLGIESFERSRGAPPDGLNFARIARYGPKPGKPGVGEAMRQFVLAGMGCAALALGACSTPGGFESVHTGNFWVQPGRYDFLKCPDLAKRWAVDLEQEKKLLELMARADQEAVGPLINLTVYRADLEQTRADMALVQQTAREKGCGSLVVAPKR